MGHEIEDLSGYLDGVLTDAEHARVEAHLKDCAECRAELDDLRQVCGMVQGLPRKPLPAGFLPRLEARRKREAAAEGWSSLLAPRSLAWVACSLTVMFVTYQSLRLYTQGPLVQGASQRAAGSFAAAVTSEPGYMGVGARGETGAAAPAASVPAEMSGPVTAGDLASLAKEQRRAEGLAAARGSMSGAGTSAAKLAAPAAPRGFGGRALGEAAEPESAYSNEVLQRHLDAERARLGIQRILTPNPVLRGLKAAARDLAPGAAQDFDKGAIPAPVAGKTAALLAAPQAGGRGAADGALVAPDDFSGTAPAKARKAMGVPLPAAVPQEIGQTAYSMEETALLWREHGLPGSPPRVDFAKEMLIVVFGRARIESAAPAGDRVVVRFRALDSAPLPTERWRVIPRSDLPVVFQPVP